MGLVTTILVSLALSHGVESQGCAAKCSRTFKPVCDGTNTYNNLCQLQCEAAKNSNIQFAYEGICCPSNSSCISNYSPVCDSAGETHSNECQFQYAACIAKKSSGAELSIVKVGSCADALVDNSHNRTISRSNLDLSGSNPILHSSVTVDSRTKSTTRGVATPDECKADCPAEFHPVCDNKGRSHDNKCRFDYERCRTKTETLYVVSVGLCPPQEPLLLVNGSLNGNEINRADSVPKLIERNNLPETTCNSSCARDYLPVCGSNGNSYPSRCILDYANCLSVKDGHGQISMTYVGPCVAKSSDKEAIEQVVTTQAPHTKPATNAVKFTSVTDVTDFLNGGGDSTLPPLKIFSQINQKSTSRPSTPAAVSSEDDCNPICTKIYQPVCTTDNRTLSNRCSYDAENCRLRKSGRPELKIDHDGPCVIDESAIVENPKFRPDPNANASVEVERPFDLADCHKTVCPTDSSEPICDTDMGQHPNICMFNQMSCLAQHFKGSPLKIAHKGPCVNDSFVIDGQLKTVDKTESAASATGGNCVSNCPAEIEPVCDAYGKTYPHICVFNFMNCLNKNKTGQPLQLAHVGPCKGDDQMFTEAPKPKDSCPKVFCTKEFRPVCASNRQTFKNLCLFNIASCQHRLANHTNLTVLHEGTCEEETILAEPTKISPPPKVNYSSPYDECPTECSDEEANVCASTGVTFKNLCSFNKAKCHVEKANGTRLMLVNFGTCESPDIFPRFNAHNCISKCTRIYLPLCDTRRATHSNLCEFNYESCETFKKSGKSLTAAYMGECKTEEEEQCGFTCMSRLDEPVCSTKAQQFANLCAFNYANCKVNSTDEHFIAHFGRCHLTNYDYSAVDFQQKSCSFSCSDDFEPVCADSGKTFQNLCAYQFESCLQRKVSDKRQILIHKGSCEGGPLAPLIVDPEAKTTLAVRLPSTSATPITTVSSTTESTTIAEATTTATETTKHAAPLRIHTTTLKPIVRTPFYCPDYCDQTPFPICSNQNGSYPTLCSFNAAKCKDLTEEIVINHMGNCNETSVPFKLFFEACSTEDCTNDHLPMCDTENTTHINFCSFKTADCVKRKLFKRGLTLKWLGDCSKPSKVLPTPDSRQPVIEVTEASAVPVQLACSSNCPKNYRPVCDTKGKTHSNKCVFDYNSCVEVKQTGTPLSLWHSGECQPNGNSTPISTANLSGQTESTTSKVPSPPRFDATDIPSNCSSICTREFKPVCSTTNDTYPNICIFNYAKCLRKEVGSDMELDHMGPCVEHLNMHTEAPNTVCPSPVCLKIYRPVCDNTGKEYENSCRFQHKKCLGAQQGITLTIATCPVGCKAKCHPGEQNRPICDSNFVTHESVCEFRKRKCEENGTTEVLFDGKCSDCIKDCPSVHSPLCSSSGRSFPNLCEFGVARCVYERRFKQNLTIMYEGECCPAVNCTSQPRNPVCASDGKIYDNECSFEAEKCQLERTKGVMLTLAPDFNCSSLPVFRRQNPVIDIAIDQTVAVNEATERIPTTPMLNNSCNKACPENLRPLCASDLRSFDNLCLFEIHQCAVGHNLTVLHEGQCCSGTNTTQCDSNPVCDSEGKTHQNLCSFEEHRCHLKTNDGKGVELVYQSACCNEKCPKNYSPVCDSDGVTHSNLCLFEAQRCLKLAKENRSLTVVSYGICSVSNCSRICSKLYKPVCGSNGVTYPNSCVLETAKCLAKSADPPITQVFEGECCSSDCPTTFNPICDNEGVTHINPCVFALKKCQANRQNKSVEIRSEGVCCSRPCTKVYRPVCDSRGKNHANLCTFRVAQCEAEQIGEELWMDYRGKCCAQNDCLNYSAPVCGSDQVTYQHRCSFEHQQCLSLRKFNQTVDLKHPGSCCTAEDCGGANDTVCDSHGRTHSSECEYRNFRCYFEKTQNTTLTIAYKGSCCERTCDGPTELLCDQHGNQYRNRCDFEVSACKRSRVNQEILWAMKCARRAA